MHPSRETNRKARRDAIVHIVEHVARKPQIAEQGSDDQEHGMMCRLPRTNGSGGRRHVQADQAGCSRPSHKFACPALAEILFLSTDHFESATVRLFLNEMVVKVAFPRGRLPGHDLEVERGRPGQQAAIDFEVGLITWWRFNRGPVPFA